MPDLDEPSVESAHDTDSDYIPSEDNGQTMTDSSHDDTSNNQDFHQAGSGN